MLVEAYTCNLYAKSLNYILTITLSNILQVNDICVRTMQFHSQHFGRWAKR